MMITKRFVFMLVVLSASACSSVQSGNSNSASANGTYDSEYMQAYETASIRGGAKVHWINPPLRKNRQRQ